MEYSIRKANLDDIEEIVQLCIEHAAYEQASYEPQGKAKQLATILFCEHPKLQCLLVAVNHTIVGYATFSYECSTWSAAYYAHMDCLFLREAYRGFGIGEALINTIVEDSKKANANHIEWQTPSFNVRAIQFYKRIGATAKEKIRFTLNI